MVNKIIIAAILFSLFTSVVFAEDWVFVASSDDGKSYYYDRESVKNQGDKKTFITRLVYAQPKDKVKTEEDEWLINCSARTCQIIYEKEYDGSGNMIYSLDTSTSTEPEAIVPGSFTDTLYQQVCR